MNIAVDKDLDLLGVRKIQIKKQSNFTFLYYFRQSKLKFCNLKEWCTCDEHDLHTVEKSTRLHIHFMTR